MGRDECIENPVSHAADKYKALFVQDDYLDLWGEYASYCTTRQFAHLDKGFIKHCGPTAITNVLLTILKKAYAEGRFSDNPDEELAAELFQRVSAIGIKKGIYWNTDFLKMFGGTYDTFTKKYLKLCLKEYIPEEVIVMRRRRASAKNFMAYLESGSICYLQLRFDKPYGSHHVVCYGYSYVRNEENNLRYMYLKIADGWASHPRYMEASDMMLNMLIPCRPLSMDCLR